jgi:hypothetical protein
MELGRALGGGSKNPSGSEKRAGGWKAAGEAVLQPEGRSEVAADEGYYSRFQTGSY